MAKPIILTADDEPQVLNAVERDLRNHYKGDYRIIKARSGAEALDALKRLKQRNEPVALFLVDQRMPEMTGTEFLAEAIKLYPEARKVLLTAYADTRAAIDSINTIGLDHYLMKPWDPPDQNLYPVLDDLLSTWWLEAPPPYDGIRVAGSLWSPASHDVKDFLSRNRIPYLWLDVEKSSEGMVLLETLPPENRKLPVVFLPDGGVLVQPSLRSLAEKVGLSTQATMPFYDLIIIGGGPAGLGAAVYGASEGLRTLMIDKEATGGQAGTSSRIENYLGFPKGLSGAELAERATTQAIRLGAELLLAQEVVKVRCEEPNKHVVLGDGSELGCKALIIASGVKVMRLSVPGIEGLEGAGVYYGAALTEAANYRQQHVFTVGGANSAGQGAMFFSRYASKVTMLVRAESLEAGMSQYLVDQIRGTPNIEVLTGKDIVALHGQNVLESIDVRDRASGAVVTCPAAALFVFIGAKPHTEMAAGLVERNAAGFILTGQDLIRDGKKPLGWKLQRDPFLLETSAPGIFAAGDVRQGAVRRVASAVGEGAIAVSLVHQYLRTV